MENPIFFPEAFWVSSKMLVCVECGGDVATLYKESASQNLRLSSCPNCHQIADKYIEWEYQIVLLDLILNRPQAYRHLLFNRWAGRGRFRELLRFLVVILAFDSFDRWYINTIRGPFPTSLSIFSAPVNVFTQWLLPHDDQWGILITTLLVTSSYILTIYACTRIYLYQEIAAKATRYSPMRLLAAIIISCFSKLGVILYMVFDAQWYHRLCIELFIILSNVIALGVYIGDDRPGKVSGRTAASTIVLIGFLVRTLVCASMSVIVPANRFSII
jgi:lipid intermediate transporter